MSSETFSIRSHHGSKSGVERAAEIIFTVCGFFAILAVVSITLYMVISGTPALFKVGILDILFRDRVGARGKRSQLRNPVCYSDFHCWHLPGEC